MDKNVRLMFFSQNNSFGIYIVGAGIRQDSLCYETFVETCIMGKNNERRRLKFGPYSLKLNQNILSDYSTVDTGKQHQKWIEFFAIVGDHGVYGN